MNEFCIQTVGKPVVATTLPPGGIVFYISRLDSRKTKSQFSVLQMDGGWNRSNWLPDFSSAKGFEFLRPRLLCESLKSDVSLNNNLPLATHLPSFLMHCTSYSYTNNTLQYFFGSDMLLKGKYISPPWRDTRVNNNLTRRLLKKQGDQESSFKAQSPGSFPQAECQRNYQGWWYYYFLK